MTPQFPAVDVAFLFEASRRLNRVLELDRLLGEIRDICLEAVDAEAVTVLIWDEDRSRLEFQLAFNRTDDEARSLHLAPGEGLAGWIAENDQPAIVNDLRWDLRYKHEVDRKLDFTGRSVLGVPIHRGRSVVGVLELVNKRGPGGFNERDLRTVTALADPIAVALENALLYRKLQREKTENQILYRIGLKLNETIDLDETLTLILDLIHEVLPYDAAGIALLDPREERLEMLAHRGYPPGAEETLRLKIGQGATGWVVKTGEPLRIADVARDRRYFMARPATRSELVVPLISGDRSIGAFNLENDRPDAYRPSDVRLLLSFANQAAISVQRARLHRDLMSRQRLQDEVTVARRIQESFLPSADPQLPGYDLSGHTTPSLEVGGDSYDAFPVADGHWGVMIADVAGKGIPAALILASFRAALRSEVRNQYAIPRILEHINALLVESTRPEQFVTAVYGVLDLQGRAFTYANAGHNPPALLRAGGRVEWLNDGGTILGSFGGTTFKESRIELGVGDILLLYTDGASEAWNASGEEFGVDRLIDILRSNRSSSAAEIRLALTEAILRHCEGKAQDDVTLLVLKAT